MSVTEVMVYTIISRSNVEHFTVLYWFEQLGHNNGVRELQHMVKYMKMYANRLSYNNIPI